MRILERIFVLWIMVLPLFAYGSSSSMVIEEAARENRHLFMFFYKDQGKETLGAQKIFTDTMQELDKRAKGITVDTRVGSEKGIVERFGVEGAPMPLVVVLAPNGAITGGFHTFSSQELVDAIASEGAANCLKALQDRKLAILCLQNEKTLRNEEALEGVNKFKKDPLFSKATEVIKIDPADNSEEQFLKKLLGEIDSKEALTVLVAPPSKVIASYKGATTKDQLISDIKKATSSCCPGGKC